MGRNKHQERALAVIQTLVAGDALTGEVGVPRAAHRIDGVVYVGEASDGWGPIRSLVADRTLVVEHFSRPPSLTALTRAFAKLGWLVDAFWRTGPAPDARAPLLLVLSCGRPRAALARLTELRLTDAPAIWLHPRPVLGDVVLVDLRRLPPGRPGTSVLRLMAIPDTAERADAGIAALLADPALVHSTVQRLLEALMDHDIPATDDEQVSILERVRCEGIEQGRREGIEQGIEQGRLGGERALLLRLLRHRFPDAVDAAVEERVGAASVAQVETWAERALSAESLAQIFGD